MSDIDLAELIHKMKARRAWRQLSFWVALAPMVAVLLPTDLRDFIVAHWKPVAAASAPMVAWLLQNGYARGESIKAVGMVQAAAAPELAKNDSLHGTPTIAEPPIESNAPMGAAPHLSEPLPSDLLDEETLEDYR